MRSVSLWNLFRSASYVVSRPHPLSCDCFVQNDDAAVKKYGVKLCIEMCRTLLEAGTPGLHFYTLNLEKSVIQILDGLGLANSPSRASSRSLPWRVVRR
jgi:hypothetical protein